MTRARAFVLVTALAVACGEPPPEDPAAARLRAAEREIDASLGLSRDAKLEIWKSMRADMLAPRHPADGGGRAWIASVQDADARRTAVLHAGERARIRMIYEAGPLGIALNGSLRLRVSPWWQWDPPQPGNPDAPGYTEVAVEETGPHPVLAMDRESRTLTMKFTQQPLAPAERIYITYGAGPALAAVDLYAEQGERFWFSVDGDGDGVHAILADSPRIDIAPGAPAQVRVVLPTTARPGERVRAHVSVLDRRANTGVPFTGEVRLSAPAGLELPKKIRFSAEQQGRQTIDARAVSAGVFRVAATASGGQLHGRADAESNPLFVEPDAPRLYWADLHGHSQLSDGSGTPEEYFRYARDVSGLDAAALTDHDHFGILFLDENPGLWDRIREANIRFHEPGRFVTVVGYEWTSLLHGHRHVLYFDDREPGSKAVLSSFDVRYQTPTQLWDALRGEPALTFAHHSAGGPISTNWRYRPDPELEPVTEIASVHGNSEAPEAPMPIYSPVAGNFVRDALDDGIRLGFIGSGDSHTGQPGYGYRGMPLGAGLAAIRADELSRAGLRRALLARRVYATNGARILLEVSIDGAPMGSRIDATRAEAESPGAPDSVLRIRVVAEAPLERIDLVSRGAVAAQPIDGALEWSGEQRIPRLRSGDYHYVRVIQRDGGAAWSSPIFAE